MRRRSGQKGGETAKPVEFCENRRVLAAILIELCENRRVLREPSSSGCDIDRVLREPSSSARSISSLITTEDGVVGCVAK